MHMYLDVLILRFKISKSLFENLNIYVNNANLKFPNRGIKRKGTKFIHSIAVNINFLTFLNSDIKRKRNKV